MRPEIIEFIKYVPRVDLSREVSAYSAQITVVVLDHLDSRRVAISSGLRISLSTLFLPLLPHSLLSTDRRKNPVTSRVHPLFIRANGDSLCRRCWTVQEIRLQNGHDLDKRLLHGLSIRHVCVRNKTWSNLSAVIPRTSNRRGMYLHLLVLRENPFYAMKIVQIEFVDEKIKHWKGKLVYALEIQNYVA